jgi:hypothetical protein
MDFPAPLTLGPMNKPKGVNRKAIDVQNPDLCDQGYSARRRKATAAVPAFPELDTVNDPRSPSAAHSFCDSGPFHQNVFGFGLR